MKGQVRAKRAIWVPVLAAWLLLALPVVPSLASARTGPSTTAGYSYDFTTALAQAPAVEGSIGDPDLAVGRVTGRPGLTAAASGVAADSGPGLLTRFRGRVGDLADDTGAVGRGNRLTSPQAAQMADRLGYGPAGRLRVKGQQVFTNGDDFIVQDIDSHLPTGLWKRAGSYEGLFSKRTRMGTYDYDLNWIGP